MRNLFYVTTPIYYVNDVPHIGHAYTTVAADILARYNRMLGKGVFFLTGTDEHGQKVEKAAKERGMTPKEHADSMVGNFGKLWVKLNISEHAFIRTTDPDHIKTVQALMQILFDSGEIEKRSYSGWYCVPDERFWTEKDLVNGNCPDCGRPVEQIREENYFFLMSKYQERLVKHIEDHPDYILPETRRNEVLGFLRSQSLGDLCISRPKSRLSWGIPLPFDDDFVTYVWFDALVNYFSATEYLAPKSGAGEEWWPASHHLIGKDILTTHAVYWSTMLMALNEPLPENIFAHGWWTVEGKKMSKSLGNVIDPNAMADKYGADAFRYFLFREVPFGLDGDFSEDALIKRINVDLANDLGNLLSRFVTMAEKYLEGKIVFSDEAGHDQFARNCIGFHSDAHRPDYWSHLRFNIILENIWNVIREANNHIAQKEPWKLAKDKSQELGAVMFNIWNALRLSAVSLYPFMPETAEKICTQLGLNSISQEVARSAASKRDGLPEIFNWDWKPGYDIKIKKGEQLFPRIEKERKVTEQKAEQKPEETKKAEDGLIGIEDFARVELKVAKVISAERVEKSDKLLRLKVEADRERQIVAGIGKVYSPEELVGKEIVIVANLKPAKLMGNLSEGMLLAASDDEGLSILRLEKPIKPGSRVK